MKKIILYFIVLMSFTAGIWAGTPGSAGKGKALQQVSNPSGKEITINETLIHDGSTELELRDGEVCTTDADCTEGDFCDAGICTELVGDSDIDTDGDGLTDDVDDDDDGDGIPDDEENDADDTDDDATDDDSDDDDATDDDDDADDDDVDDDADDDDADDDDADDDDADDDDADDDDADDDDA
ncbi:MAG: hypothetical protein H8E60_01140, partial [Candidatus Marinimicrobia bacterium]|nr:hypothetical protein [Candidatus Neomarinimicrobiota bacterium]